MFPSSLNYQQGNSVTQESIVKSYLWTSDIICNLLLYILFDNLRLGFMLYFLEHAFLKHDKLGFCNQLCHAGWKCNSLFQVYVYRQIISSTRTESFSFKNFTYIYLFNFFLAVPSLYCCGGLCLVVVCRLLVVVVSLVEHSLQGIWFSSCSP